MRTTLNLDDDVLNAAKERARRERRSVGEVVSELARTGLTRPTTGAISARRKSATGFHPLPRRGSLVTNALIDELREDDAE